MPRNWTFDACSVHTALELPNKSEALRDFAQICITLYESYTKISEFEAFLMGNHFCRIHSNIIAIAFRKPIGRFGMA